MSRDSPSEMNKDSPTANASPGYWLTRFMILRLLGAVYAVAFLVTINQAIPLIGSHGLTPIGMYVQTVRVAFGSTASGFAKLPSILWFAHSDTSMFTIAWIGLLLSVVVMCGYANMPVMATIWFLYMSFVHLGQEWFSYGWEIQLSETGFLAIFLCPLLDMRPFPRHPPPLPIIILYRWLTFRLMLGAGLIKIRGDEIWRNGTALFYHFETQPIPGPLSRWFHFLPGFVLRVGVWFNWIAELVAPWFVFWPRLARTAAGIVIIAFQLTLILSGNLSFLNWLSIVPAFTCFDDLFWAKILPSKLVRKAQCASAHSHVSRRITVLTWIVTATIILLSIQPVANMISPQQVMNTSFDPIDLVNTYGAFGSVSKERLNVVFEGTSENDSTDNAKWLEYAYKGLPTSVDKLPPQIAPYQLRLDWQMWFAAMSTPDEYPWTYNLVWKMLHNDRTTLALFATNPFANNPPRFVRAVLYRYTFASPGNPQHAYWNRQRLRLWIHPLSGDDLRLIDYLRSYGWHG